MPDQFANPQAVLNRRIPEECGPLDESESGACLPAAPDPRPHASTQPLDSETIDRQNAEAAAEAARARGIEKRTLAAVRRELAKTTGASR